MIGRIYLLKSSDRTPPYCQMALIGNCQPAQTVPKQRPKATVRNPNTWQISKNTTHMFQYCSAKVLLRFSASKAPPPRRLPLAFAHAQNALSHLPVSKTPIQACMHPKRLSCSLEPKAALRDCLHPGHSFALAELKATLCVGLYPNRPLEPACAQSPSCPPESKAALRGCLNPRLPFTITRIQSPSCHPGSKDPPRVRPSLKHPSCSPKS